MIQIHTPEGIKEISEEEALKIGIKLPRNLEKEINELKREIKKLKSKVVIQYGR